MQLWMRFQNRQANNQQNDISSNEAYGAWHGRVLVQGMQWRATAAHQGLQEVRSFQMFRLRRGFLSMPEISTPVTRAEYRIRFGDAVYWCRKCSGEAPQHIKGYEKYAEADCGECFFRHRR